MSDVHTPPSTYILRELHDVAVPDSVGWWPQTLGWQVLGFALFIVVVYLAYRHAVIWWHRRYRGEASAAVLRLDPRDPMMAKELFSITKLVLTHLDVANAKLFAEPCLRQLEALASHPTSRLTHKSGRTLKAASAQHAFSDELAARWMSHLYNPAVVLDEQENGELKQRILEWLASHHDASSPTYFPAWVNRGGQHE